MVVGVGMVKDEGDVIGDTVAHMLGHVDHVIVADNGSTDDTWKILGSIATDSETNHRLTVQDDPEPAYYQSEKMSTLAEQAREMGATWVVPFDADEFWMPCTGSTISEALEALPAETLIVEAAVHDHVATSEGGLSPWRRRDPLPLCKVAARAREGLTIHQGNHGASFDGIDVPQRVAGLLQIHHFPYRSGDQFVSKIRNGAAAYAATDLPEDVGAHWRQYGRHLDENGAQAVINNIFLTHFFSADPEGDGLVYDPVP